MNEDSQSCIQASETGWKLTISSDVEDVDEEEPRHDEEALQDSDIQQTRHDEPHCEKKPRPDAEAESASDSQHTELDAQAYCEKKPHPDTEDQYNKEPSRDVEAQCKDGFSLEKNSSVQLFKEPHPDEEAGLNNITHLDNEAHYDRGWAWVVLGTTFLMEVFVGGLITSSGVIYAALVDEFNKSRAETGKLIYSTLIQH